MDPKLSADAEAKSKTVCIGKYLFGSGARIRYPHAANLVAAAGTITAPSSRRRQGTGAWAALEFTSMRGGSGTACVTHP